MYIVQIKNPARYTWRTLDGVKCEFRALHKAVALYREIAQSPKYAGMDVRIWQPEAESRVYVDVPGHLHVAKDRP